MDKHEMKNIVYEIESRILKPFNLSYEMMTFDFGEYILSTGVN